jgi:hypothetical protein
MNQLSRISPISDAEAARTVRASTLADLAGQITATEQMADSEGSSRRTRRRPLALALTGIPVAAGIAVAAVILAAGQPAPVQAGAPVKAGAPAKAGHPSQPAGGGSARLTAALSFGTSGGYITVRVVNPLADASRYRAEFAQHHLKITLDLVPASPSIVGTLVYFSEPTGGDITPITAQGKCFTGGGGSACPVGVRIPDGFRGQAAIVFGRAAKPGEQYESTAPATASGEVMHGMTFKGMTVAQVLAMLRQRQVTVPVYNYDDHGVGKQLRRVPGTWFVYDAVPWASGQVMLFVGPTWPQPVTSTPVPGSPIPSPTAP